MQTVHELVYVTVSGVDLLWCLLFDGREKRCRIPFLILLLTKVQRLEEVIADNEEGGNVLCTFLVSAKHIHTPMLPFM